MLASSVITPGAAFPDADSPDVALDFEPRILHLAIDGNSGDAVEYSTDGETVHGRLIVGVISSIERATRCRKLWIRKTVGSPDVIVEADGFTREWGN